MGVSTDAILAFGIPLEEGAIENYDEDNDPEEGPAWMVWSGEEEDGIKIIEHCSDACPMYFLTTNTVNNLRASRGYPELIFSDELKPANKLDSSWSENQGQLDAFIKKYNLEEYVEGKLGWYLLSWWGYRKNNLDKSCRK